MKHGIGFVSVVGKISLSFLDGVGQGECFGECFESRDSTAEALVLLRLRLMQCIGNPRCWCIGLDSVCFGRPLVQAKHLHR